MSWKKSPNVRFVCTYFNMYGPFQLSLLKIELKSFLAKTHLFPSFLLASLLFFTNEMN